MEFLQSPGRIWACGPDGALLAEVTFPAAGGVAGIDHTFVDPSLRGQGVAEQLLAAAAAQIRANGWKARPICSYAAGWFARHPEQADLLEG